MYESVRFYRQIETPSFIATPKTAAGYIGPGDIVSSASAWWGLRAYSLATAGTAAVRLRRDSDNVESDFSTLANGNLDVASIATFKGAANLLVTKLYDQTGNGFDLAQSTAASQPSFTLSAIGTLPAVQFPNQTGYSLATAGALTISQPFTVSLLARATRAVGATTELFNLTSGSNGPGIELNNLATSLDIVDAAGGTANVPGLTLNTNFAMECVFNGVSSLCYIDGVSNASTTGTGGVSDIATLGYYGQHSGTKFEGLVGEVGVWPSGFSAGNAGSMNTNQHTYWG